MSIIERHQLMYKQQTPPWKDSFRAKCLERLKSRRTQLVEKFRGINTEKELDATNTEIDEMISIMDEIKRELQEEELKLLEEYSKDTRTYEDEENIVTCPICKKDILHQNHTIIFCACGLRIDVQQDGLHLGHLKTELYRGLREHDSCPFPSSFSLVTFNENNHLTISCEGCCDFLYVVI